MGNPITRTSNRSSQGVFSHLCLRKASAVHPVSTGLGGSAGIAAYYGHLVLRLMGSFVLFYTSRVICKGCLTMEEIIFSLKHYWRLVDLEALGLQALS